MGTKKRSKSPANPFGGAVLRGLIPGGADVTRFVITHKPLCNKEQWEALGRPAVTIRYGLGYRDDSLFGHTYALTWLDPTRTIAAQLICPDNCRTIDVGLVTPAGSHWEPADIMRADDEGQARDYVRRRTGQDQPVAYWDHSLTEENTARYITATGEVSRVPQMPAGSDPDDPAALLRMADDGNPLAADATPTEGK